MRISHFLLTATLLVSTGAWAVDGSLTLTGATDYRYRGISQTAGDPAIQGSFDLAWDNGFYAGVWASNVDFEDDANIEVDWYGGYYWEISDTVGLDLMANYYTYPDYSGDADYLELVANLEVSDFAFQYAYAYDFFNTGDPAHYLAADYSYEIAEQAAVFEGISLDLHIGYSFGDYWDRWDIGDYTDYSVGVSASWSRVDMSLAWLDNSVSHIEFIPGGAYRNDSTVLFTLSSTFDLF